MSRAARQYGYSERQRSIRDRVNATSKRYSSNMYRHFGGDAYGRTNEGVPRRNYMGLRIAQGGKG